MPQTALISRSTATRLNTYDDNGDGVLNAADAKFSQFKLLMTNADGSYRAKKRNDERISFFAINAKEPGRARLAANDKAARIGKAA